MVQIMTQRSVLNTCSATTRPQENLDPSQTATYIGAHAWILAVIVKAGRGIKGVLYAGLSAAVTCYPWKKKTRVKQKPSFLRELACPPKGLVRR